MAQRALQETALQQAHANVYSNSISQGWLHLSAELLISYKNVFSL